MQIFLFESDAGPGRTTRWSAELEDVRSAQVAAIRTLGELLADDGAEFWANEGVLMTVFDENGLMLFRWTRAPSSLLHYRGARSVCLVFSL
jgi:hypothetical protein